MNETKIRELGEPCPACKERNALSVWTNGRGDFWLACDLCDWREADV